MASTNMYGTVSIIESAQSWPHGPSSRPMMPTLSPPPKECHLLALPAELRLEIFAHLANEPSPLEQLTRAAQAGTFLYTEKVVRMLYRAIDTGFM
ncbi:hypothetical protein LTR95_012724 [Oleoguttula sp. CCFEE 5521]